MVHIKQVWLAFRYGEFYGCSPKIVQECTGEGWQWIARNVTKRQLEDIVECDISDIEFNKELGFYKEA